MQTLGELRSADGQWLALIHDRPDGTFGFRLFQLDAQASKWVEVPGQPESALATEDDALAEATKRYPELVGQPYRRHPLEDPPESPEALRARGRQALLGAVALAIGIGFMYFRHCWPGIVFLSLGCLGLGWSMGGYGSVGYGGSNS